MALSQYAIERVYLPGGDPSRVEVRFSTPSLGALQGALAAATMGQLTVEQADAAIEVLQRYISASDSAALRAGKDPAAQQKLDAADGQPSLADLKRSASGGSLSRHEAESAIHLLHRTVRRPQHAHHDARDTDTHGPGCSCDASGLCTHTDSNDRTERTTMSKADEDREQARRDYELATMSPKAREGLERMRAEYDAKERSLRAPLQGQVRAAMSKMDAWDVGDLQNRPNTSTITPSGGTASPRPGDTGAKVGPDGATSSSRSERPAHERSFRELGIIGGMSKDADGFSGFDGFRSRQEHACQFENGRCIECGATGPEAA